jgi:hypothetical protein
MNRRQIICRRITRTGKGGLGREKQALKSYFEIKSVRKK